MGRVHRILRWIVFTVAGIIGLATVLVLAGPSLRHWQVERAIARFEKHPSQARADSLVALLQMHAATGEQGKRALALLLRPKITTRKAYAVGRPITIATELPFELNFRRFLWNEEAISVNGQQVIQHHGARTLNHGTTNLNLPISHTQPGVYAVELRIQCSLAIERTGMMTTVLGHLHDGLPGLIPDPAAWRPARTYECDFTVSSEVMVGGDDAEEIELVSSPESDKAMRAAFSVRCIGLGGRSWAPVGTPSVTVSYTNIPLAAAFHVALRLPDGREMPVRGVWPGPFILARAGSSNSFIVDPSNFPVATLDQYRATLVLTPDPDLAYQDVATKSMWNGTLEFPISFSLTADPNGPRQTGR